MVERSDTNFHPCQQMKAAQIDHIHLHHVHVQKSCTLFLDSWVHLCKTYGFLTVNGTLFMLPTEKQWSPGLTAPVSTWCRFIVLGAPKFQFPSSEYLIFYRNPCNVMNIVMFTSWSLIFP